MNQDLKIIHNSDVSINILKKLKIGIVGYGNKGRAQALNLKDRGYEYWPYVSTKKLKIGKLNFTHGDYVPIHHAKKHLASYKENIMYGHTHDLQRFTETGLGGTQSAWSMGCLKNTNSDKNKWMRGNLNNWNHALLLLIFLQKVKALF